jgi:hypothetical protein
MFIEVYIVQCKSTGEFLTPNMNYSTRPQNAGLFTSRLSAVDTAFNELDNDFELFSFYVKESTLPPYCLGAGL